MNCQKNIVHLVHEKTTRGPAGVKGIVPMVLPRIATDLDILAHGERLTLDLDPSIL